MSAATPAPTGIPYQGIAEPTPRNSFFRRRAPTTRDYTNYRVGDRWIDRSSNQAWILVSKAAGIALWQLMSGGGGAINTIQLFPPVAANFNLLNLGGLTIAVAPGLISFGANVDGVVTQIVANQITVQRTSASALSNPLLNGVGHFNNAQFSVDANGFVSLAGGGLPIDQIQVDAATAPGVNPVDPTAGGLVTFNGVVVAAQTIPVRSRSVALNQYQLEVQRASSSVATNATQQGLASFNSAQFTVDVNGFVSSLNGLPASAFDVQANTAPGTDPVVPNALGVVAVSGAQVAAVAIPIQTNSIAANSYEIQVQRSSAQAISTLSANGICHFSSAQFSVDANGFVQSLASVAFTWQDSAPVAMAITNGYFATGAGVYSLPLGVVNGETIEIIDNIGGGVVVTAAGAQTIRVQNVNSSAGGTCTSTQFGDALRLIFRASIGEWQVCPGAGGNWILA